MSCRKRAGVETRVSGEQINHFNRDGAAFRPHPAQTALVWDQPADDFCSMHTVQALSFLKLAHVRLTHHC